MASPNFAINGGTVNEKASVAAGGAVQGIIDDIDGVQQVEWTLERTDDSTLPAAYVLVTSGSVGQQVDTTALTAGTAAVLKARINGGLVNDEVSKATIREVKFFVPLANGLDVLTNGEVGDAQEPDVTSSPTHGAVEPINAAMRLAASILADWKESGRLATAGAIAAHSFSAGVITFTAIGSQSVDTIATAINDRILLKEGTDLENGIYFVSTKGDGSTQEVWTRTPDADETGEISNGTTIFVGPEGASIPVDGRAFRQIEIDPITMNTTPQTWTEVIAGIDFASKPVTDRSVVTASGTAGELVQDSLVTIGATGPMTWDESASMVLSQTIASAGAGAAASITAQSAAVGSNANGANLTLRPGALDGAGLHGLMQLNGGDGLLKFQAQSDGDVVIRGTDEILIQTVSTTRLTIATTFLLMGVGDMRILTTTTPLFRHLNDGGDGGGGGVTGAVYTTLAQSTTGTGLNNVGGSFLARGGDASNGTVSNIGGPATMRSGSGADGNGAVVLQVGNTTPRFTLFDDTGLGEVVMILDIEEIRIDDARGPITIGHELSTSKTTGASISYLGQQLTTAGGTKTAGAALLQGGACAGAGTNNGGAASVTGGDATGGTNNGGDALVTPGLGTALNGSSRIRNAAGTTVIQVNSTGIGVNGQTPIAQPAAYSITNPVDRRTFDTTTVTLVQLAEIVGTMIQDDINFGWKQ